MTSPISCASAAGSFLPIPCRPTAKTSSSSASSSATALREPWPTRCSSKCRASSTTSPSTRQNRHWRSPAQNRTTTPADRLHAADSPAITRRAGRGPLRRWVEEVRSSADCVLIIAPNTSRSRCVAKSFCWQLFCLHPAHRAAAQHPVIFLWPNGAPMTF